MKRIISASLVAALALTGAQAATNAQLSAELADVKKQLKKQNKKINAVKAHDSGDNIKWGVDFRTTLDNINYDMADGTSRGKSDLMATRLWLNMAYAPDAHNVFKGQLAYNKAFGADFHGQTGNMPRGYGLDSFDWIVNEALTGNALKVRQAYWLYLGDKAFGADIPWTFSVGRRPSTGGFLANFRNDDAAQSPLGHIINVEFDGLSSKLDLSKVTGVDGMSFKLCMGQGSTNAAPLFSRLDGTSYSDQSDEAGQLEDIKLAGFIFEPYNDGQYIVKTTAFRAFDLPGYDGENFFKAFNGQPALMSQVGDMDGAALSVLVDGLTEEGYFADVKVFGSFAWSKTRPDAGSQMLGMTMGNAFAAFDPNQPSTVTFGAEAGESKTGTSYWFGAQLPVTVADENYGTVGVEYNHGSEYWRPFDYAEDTMIGSKLAARGDAWEAYYTYQINDALSAQVRYTSIDYDYAGSNGFFASDGVPMKIDTVKENAAMSEGFLTGPASMDPTVPPTLATLQAMLDGGMLPAGLTQDHVDATEAQAQMAVGMAQSIVEKAQDLRFYLRYRF